VTHTADLNGDGKADLLWRNTTGTVVVWLMNGTANIGAVGILSDPNWSVSHTADFNGDGKADLLWRNTNGAVTIWFMNGLASTGAAGLLGVDPNWRVTHIGDYNGDGRADIVWRNAADGSIAMWLINGATVTSSSLILGASPWVISPSVVDGEPTFRKIFGTADNCVDNAISTDPTSDADINIASAVVAYWGDPGTDELNFQVSNPVTWSVDTLLNMPNPTKKLGYWNNGLLGTSATVLKCNEAGFFLNTFQFTHAQPIRGGGPNGQLKKKVSFPQAIFTNMQSDLIIQGLIKHPFHHWNDIGATGQISLYYYVQPLRCPNYANGLCPAANITNNIPAFAHLLGIFESRYPNGYDETSQNDTFTNFFSSPLVDQLPNGATPKYVKKSPYSFAYTGGSESTWNEARFFRGEISYARMKAMINEVRAVNSTIALQTSPDPTDWGIVLIGGLLETFPRTSASDGSPCTRNTNKPGCLDIVMGVTFSTIEAYERIPAVMGLKSMEAKSLLKNEDNSTTLIPKLPLATEPHFSAERIRALLR
jgi:FG-GAP-like repeat/FG-GAP repeat